MPEACLRRSPAVTMGRYVKQGWPNPTFMPGTHLTVADRDAPWAVSGTLGHCWILHFIRKANPGSPASSSIYCTNSTGYMQQCTVWRRQHIQSRIMRKLSRSHEAALPMEGMTTEGLNDAEPRRDVLQMGCVVVQEAV